MPPTTRFVTVVQRRPLMVDEQLFPLIEHLYSIESHTSFEERNLLFQTAIHLSRNFVACEIGSYLGSSTCFLATAARLLSGRIHCVDTWDNRAMGFEPARDTYADFLHNTADYLDLLTLHRGASTEVAQDVSAGLDLLFLDGDHAYDAARADLFAYGPKLKPGGMLALHDFTEESVRHACHEYLTTRPGQPVGAAGSLHVFQVN